MRRILNICLNGPYTEGLTYQDNLLPKYQVKMGYEVIILASSWYIAASGAMEHAEERDYVNEWGVRVITLDDDQGKGPRYKFKTYGKLGGILESLKPDILFLHGCQARDSRTIAEFMASHGDVRLFVDNHADYSNSATNWLSKHVLHRIVWRHYARLLDPYAEKFWGVLPARVDFLVENYGLPLEKCDLLIMGADDDEVKRASKPSVRSEVRCRFGIDDDDLLLVTGGKVDAAKSEVLNLMDAVALRSDRQVRLLVFGPVAPELHDAFEERATASNIEHVAWASSSEAYDYFSAADLVVFPGRHSVYWEQACGMGKPVVVKYWRGTNHVDCGGNASFLETASSDEIGELLDQLLAFPEQLASMETAAIEAAPRFLYSQIAKRSILEDFEA